MARNEYYQHVRNDIFHFLPPDVSSILELGCGAGNTLREIKKNHDLKRIVGLDISSDAIEQASDILDESFVLDLDKERLPKDLGTFDAVLCLDVLEHLKDPWGTLTDLYNLVKNDGCLIVSIPNIRFYGIIINLLFRGRWEYTSAGILDRTHLRFFTKKSLIELIEGANFGIQKLEPKFTGRKRKFLNRITLGLFSDFLCKQYIVKAGKRASGL